MTKRELLSVNTTIPVGTDSFGHKMLAGCGKYLENLVRNRLGVKARSVELNVSQRCSASMISATDQQEAGSRRAVRCPQRTEGRDWKNGFLCQRFQRSLPYAPWS